MRGLSYKCFVIIKAGLFYNIAQKKTHLNPKCSKRFSPARFTVPFFVNYNYTKVKGTNYTQDIRSKIISAILSLY
jgi:hypothetical protein